MLTATPSVTVSIDKDMQTALIFSINYCSVFHNYIQIRTF